MKSYAFALLIGLVPLLVSAEDPVAPAASAIPAANGWHYADIRRLPAPEARQGVAVDDEFLYVISNHALGKYRKDTGVRVAAWECPPGEPLTHLNAGIVHEGRLYCAHSNYPGVPNLSSVEIWDTATLRHVGTHSFGQADGSFTWLDRRNDRWIACFAHYTGKGAEPGRGSEWTRLVEFDDDWRQTGGWAFPADLMQKLAVRGFSVSGGAFGPGGLLYVTGHDDAALYVLKMPEAGPILKWVATIPITAHGQAFSWDPHDPSLLYTLSKAGREVLVGRVTRGSMDLEALGKTGHDDWLERSMGLQLWSLRDQMKSDVKAALSLVPGYGLSKVELAGLGGVTPAVFRGLLDQNGLVPIGAHYGFDRLQDDLPGVIAEAKTLGVEYVICTSLPPTVKEWTASEMERFATDFNACGRKLHEAGLHLVFHTHGREFAPLKAGSRETLLDFLARKTDPELVCFEMDVFWVMRAGQDPIALLGRYPGRWRLMHLKDMRPGAVTGLFGGHASPAERVAIGSGQLNWPRLLSAAHAAGIRFYFIEDETTDPLKNVPLSLHYLRHL